MSGRGVSGQGLEGDRDAVRQTGSGDGAALPGRTELTPALSPPGPVPGLQAERGDGGGRDGQEGSPGPAARLVSPIFRQEKEGVREGRAGQGSPGAPGAHWRLLGGGGVREPLPSPGAGAAPPGCSAPSGLTAQPGGSGTTDVMLCHH